MPETPSHHVSETKKRNRVTQARMMFMKTPVVTRICILLCIASFLIPSGVIAVSGDEPTQTGAIPSTVDISGINAINSPYIISYVTVNTTAGRAGHLTKEDFSVYEDGKQMDIASVRFSDPATPTQLDLVIIFDDSGSLSDKIAGMKAKVNELTQNINSANIDCRYALITFKDTVSVHQEWTSDPAEIRSAVNELEAMGGDDTPESDLDAIEKALTMQFRPDAQHMILDITDERTHYRGDGTSFSNYTIEETASHLISNGTSYILVGPVLVSGIVNHQNDKRELVAALGGSGFFFDINSDDFSQILDNIQSIITQTYTVGYYSPNKSNDGNTRTVLVKVGTDTDSAQYVATVPIQSGIPVAITPDTASRGTTVPVEITGTHFPPGGTVRLLHDTYSIPLTEENSTPSSLSGFLEIPDDAPVGLYQLEITSPEGNTTTGDNPFTISSSDQPDRAVSLTLPGKDDRNDSRDHSYDQESSKPGSAGCTGGEGNSGYHLIARNTGVASSVDRIPDPWCWCNDFPYDRNYQTCVPPQS